MWTSVNGPKMRKIWSMPLNTIEPEAKDNNKVPMAHTSTLAVTSLAWHRKNNSGARQCSEHGGRLCTICPTVKHDPKSVIFSWNCLPPPCKAATLRTNKLLKLRSP